MSFDLGKEQTEACLREATWLGRRRRVRLANEIPPSSNVPDDTLDEVFLGARDRSADVAADRAERVEPDPVQNDAWLYHVRDKAFDAILLRTARCSASRPQRCVEVVPGEMSEDALRGRSRHVDAEHLAKYRDEILGQKRTPVLHEDEAGGA